jgi:MFS family permease
MSQFAYGLLFGISMPISQVVISEIVPLRYRGRFIVLLQLIYICGILYLTGCCFIFLDSFSSGDWRSLLRINAIPASLCLLGSMVFLRESPRLYIAQGRYEKGFIELDGMGRKNDASYIQITESEQTGMKLWRETILKD